ncbi:MAG TPA: transposase, partial [bacterium]|nr:transposase [bacterium]HPG45739.1 transposase [bacterium]HPM97482.1 transposase [bacterium]
TQLIYKIGSINAIFQKFLKDIKGSSSAWINEKGLARGKFVWQAGYGAFSYSHSHVDTVVKYILRQEEHHKIKTFREEYIEFLKKYQIEYNDRYILKDIEK